MEQRLESHCCRAGVQSCISYIIVTTFTYIEMSQLTVKSMLSIEHEQATYIHIRYDMIHRSPSRHTASRNQTLIHEFVLKKGQVCGLRQVGHCNTNEVPSMTRRWHSDEKPIVTPGKGWALEFALTNDEHGATSGIGCSLPEHHGSPRRNAVRMFARETNLK